jgi:hypothetical protein
MLSLTRAASTRVIYRKTQHFSHIERFPRRTSAGWGHTCSGSRREEYERSFIKQFWRWLLEHLLELEPNDHHENLVGSLFVSK